MVEHFVAASIISKIKVFITVIINTRKYCCREKKPPYYALFITCELYECGDMNARDRKKERKNHDHENLVKTSNLCIPRVYMTEDDKDGKYNASYKL
jgi:hypothetical protein